MQVAYADPAAVAVEENPPLWMLWALMLLCCFVVTMNFDFNPAGLVEDASESAGTFSRFRPMVMLLMGGIGALAFWRRRHAPAIHNANGLLLLSFFGMVSCSFLWADDAMVVLRRIVTFWMLCTCAFGLASLMSYREIQKFVAFIGIAITVISLLIQAKSGILFTVRFGSMLGANLQGTVIGLTMITVMALAYKRWSIVSTVFVVGTLFTLLVMTGSRGALVGTMLGVFAWRLLADRRPVRLFLQCLLLVAIALPLAYFALDDFGDKMAEMVMLGRQDSGASETTSLTGRVPLWTFLVENHVSQRPLIGHGFGGFWNESNIRKVSNTQDWNIVFSHSAFVDMLLDLGIFGLTLYVATFLGSIIMATVHALRGDVNGAYVAAILTAILFNSIVETVLLNPVLTSLAGMMLIAKITLFKEPPRREAARPSMDRP